MTSNIPEIEKDLENMLDTPIEWETWDFTYTDSRGVTDTISANGMKHIIPMIEIIKNNGGKNIVIKQVEPSIEQ